jgi:hypothetical protein
MTEISQYLYYGFIGGIILSLVFKLGKWLQEEKRKKEK